MSQAITRRPDRQSVRSLAWSDHGRLVDPGQPLQLDTGVVFCPLQELGGGQSFRGLLHANALDPATPGGLGIRRFEQDPVVRWGVLALGVSHWSPPHAYRARLMYGDCTAAGAQQ